MTWLLLVGTLLACVALAALSHVRAGWELWRIRRSLRTGSMDAPEALGAFARGMRDLNCRPTGGWRTWGSLLRRRDL